MQHSSTQLAHRRGFWTLTTHPHTDHLSNNLVWSRAQDGKAAPAKGKAAAKAGDKKNIVRRSVDKVASAASALKAKVRPACKIIESVKYNLHIIMVLKASLVACNGDRGSAELMRS